MKVRMKKTVDGAPEGTHVVKYLEGSEHDLSHSERSRDLAAVFLREGWAAEVGTADEAEFLKGVEDRKRMFDAIDARVAKEATEAKAAAEAPPVEQLPAKAEKRKVK